MTRTLLASLVASLAVGLTPLVAQAADAKIDAAVKTFKQVEGDAAKLKTFCAMSNAMDAEGDKEDAAADAKIDGYMKELGPDFETAWNAGENLDENSPDGKRLNDAMDELASKCPQQ
jgi:hypothetical protein